MGNILRRYVIREIFLPTLLALITITFILIIGTIHDLIDLLLQPSITFFQILEILAGFVPSILLFSVPMAVLIGVLIGVGRMTLDREILAVRASGINLFQVFYPSLFVALLISLAVMWMAGGFIPNMLHYGMRKAADLRMALISSLEPGRFHDELGGESDIILYFGDRDPATHDMQQIILKLEDDVRIAEGRRDILLTSDSLYAHLPDDTAQGLRQALKTRQAPNERPELTTIFAQRGHIETTELPNDDVDAAESRIVLSLLNGSIHRLSPKPGERDYVVIHFDRLEKQLFSSVRIEKRYKTMQNAELRELITSNQLRDEDKIGNVHKELTERHSMALATFVFALMGIPLSIWVRPGGKSLGILLAIGLMLVYYLLLQMGLTMVEERRAYGLFMAYMPNGLFLILGGALWWQTLRS